jgi:hypothetical protein
VARRQGIVVTDHELRFAALEARAADAEQRLELLEQTYSELATAVLLLAERETEPPEEAS